MINLTPGPVHPTNEVLACYQQFLGAPRLSHDFWTDYQALHGHLQTILQTDNQIAIMTGEGMVALWAGLNSIVMPGDKIVSVVNGLYGDGIADICEKLGADVTRVSFTDTEFDKGAVMQAVEHTQPKMITAVHSETPTGLLNPLNDIATIKNDFAVPLLYVDAISSIGATPVNVDMNSIDILLGSAAKALGGLADISFVSVSDEAWHAICKKNYRLGYDALLPFKDIEHLQDFPYMPHWPGIRALKTACENLIATGLRKVYEQHVACMEYCVDRLANMGLTVFQTDKSLRSPSVTACYLPASISWYQFNKKLTQAGVQFGAGMGEWQDKLFRIGHMGPQAELKSLEKAMDSLSDIVARL